MNRCPSLGSNIETQAVGPLQSSPMRISSLILTLLAATIIAGCSTHSDRMKGFREAWHVSDFARADAEVDAVLTSELGLKPGQFHTEMRNLPAGVNPQKGDTALLLLEKGMTLLSLGHPNAATVCFRAARDALDESESANVGDFLKSAVSDDTAYDYAGADYERIMVRLMLALTDLISGTGDARAFALQVGEKQEQIIGTPLGDSHGYQPRESYRRVAAGAYLEAIMLESQSAYSEAELVYKRMLSWEPDSQLAKSGLERVQSGAPVAAGHGVVHIFRLAGRGPHLVEEKMNGTSDAMRIAGLYLGLAHNRWSMLAQTRIPVPGLQVNQSAVPQAKFIKVALPEDGVIFGDHPNHYTSTLLDVNRVAKEQLDAWMPMIAARAMVRRAVKTGVAATLEEVGARQDNKTTGTVLRAVAILGNLAWTATETADTRSWSSLPAEFQAARVELPAGKGLIYLQDPASMIELRITPGRDHYVLIIQPDLTKPGTVLVDPWSQAID